MQLFKIHPEADAHACFSRLGATGQGAKIMAQKSSLLWFYLRDLPTPAANILKQDALSLGAELVVPKGVVVCETSQVDAVLLGTPAQLSELADKESTQPFGLPAVANMLRRHLVEPPARPVRIMGVLNANQDSFYARSRFRPEEAYGKITAMIEAGADIIDIGAVSSRPGSESVSAEEELARIAPVVDLIERESLHQQTVFSVDTFEPRVAAYALERGFGIINDITALSRTGMAEVVAEHGAAVVLMHMQGTPEAMQDDPRYDDLLAEVAQFFESRIELAEQKGVGEIILDVGIGFGKTLSHNLQLLNHLQHFDYLGKEMLIGASRKSLIHAITPAPPEERLPGTLTIHLEAVKRGATIVRCHDVAAHVQALKVYEAIQSENFS